MMSKIYWCHSHFLNWMGGSKYILEVTKRLSKKYKIIVVASCISKEAKRKFAEAGIKTISLGERSTNSVLYWANLRGNIVSESKKLKKIVEKDDLIISSMFPMNCIAGKLNNAHIQCLWEPYSLFHDKNYISGFTFPQQVFIKIIRWFYKSLDLEATRHSNMIITLSYFYKDWIKKIYGRNDAAVAYEGVDTSFFKKSLNKNLKKKFEGKKIMFHSTDFTALKGTKYLVHAIPEILSKYPDSIILISSTIENSAEKEKYLKFADMNNFRNKIFFLGKIKYNLLPDYYSIANVVVQPAIKQNMSLPVKEAMSCETPVVTCKEGYEQTPDGKAGYLVDSDNHNEIARAVVKILKDEKRARKMGEEGRRIVLEKFTWDKVASVYEKIINSLEQ